LDYNAGLVGALAGMSKYFGQGQMPEDTPGIEGEPPVYYADAKIYEENESGITVDLNMYNIVTSPPQYESDLSCRYFVDLSEYAGENIDMSKFVTKVYYSPAGATISELKPYDKEKNIYYVEISFPNPVYARTYVQFCIYYYENKLWDSSNDFSYQGIGDTYKTLENIPIYKNGVLVAGKEPSGAGPVEPTPPPKNYVYGDVNGDGKVNSTDCSIVKRYLLKNIEDFPYEYGKEAGDVNGDGKVNSTDYSLLKRFVLRNIDKFPVEQ